jgi:BCD family chlorophyll transporter-like MFS transporter
MSEDHVTPPFSIWQTVRLSSFQIGSAMGDILATSIWNRILISNFGIAAAPVSFLLALRYLLSPLSLWAGHRSDTKLLWGWRRTPYIWIGRGMMILALPLLGASLGRLAGSQSDFLGWAFATLSSLLYGVGTLISGSPFLALVRDSAPERRQGFAISVVEIALITLFAIIGLIFSRVMKEYDEGVFWQLVLATMVIGGFFWFFAVAGAEKRLRASADTAEARPEAPVPREQVLNTFKRIWADPRARRFFLFLSLATLSAWVQDAILEPFGAEVFDLPVERTTRFNSYWQGATVITLVASAYLWRKRPPEMQGSIAKMGLLIMASGMVLLGGSALAGQARLVEASLLVFGFGFGIYTFGGVSLMVVMASNEDAGAYLGLWSISILVSRGLGIFMGGATRDLLLLNLRLAQTLSYSIVFIAAAVGLFGAAAMLNRLDILGFARDVGRPVSRVEAQIANAD